MTQEEMNAVIQDHCKKQDYLCKHCVLEKICDSCGGDYLDENHYDKCKEAYDVLVGTNKDKTTNPYWENICKLQDKQRKKGIETYGQGLEDNHQPVSVRIQHIEEELIDALMYLEWLKDKLGGMHNG
jgi:uncharacterized protein (DUF2164 family)